MNTPISRRCSQKAFIASMILKSLRCMIASNSSRMHNTCGATPRDATTRARYQPQGTSSATRRLSVYSPCIVYSSTVVSYCTHLHAPSMSTVVSSDVSNPPSVAAVSCIVLPAWETLLLLHRNPLYLRLAARLISVYSLTMTPFFVCRSV